MEPRINEYNIFTLKQIDEVKLLIISDSHIRNDKYTEELFKVLSMAKELKPDYICILGDYLDSFAVDKEKALSILFELSKIAPTFKILAAHDINDYKNIEELQQYYNQLVSLNPGDFTPFIPGKEKKIQVRDNLFIGGCSISPNMNPFIENNREEYIKTMKPTFERFGFNSSDYNILFTHTPIFKPYADLILSGHLHAGVSPKFLEFLKLGFFYPGKGFHIFKNASGLFNYEEFSQFISSPYLMVPGTIIDEHKMGYLLYKIFNELYRRNISFLTISGEQRDKSYPVLKRQNNQ